MKSIEKSIKPMAKLSQDESQNILIYGDPKIGKTRLASELGRIYKTLYVDLESGTKSIDTGIPNLDGISVQSYGEMQELYNYLASGESGYEAVVVDNMSELQDKIIRQTVSDFPQVHRPYRDTPGQSDYGRVIDLVIRFIKAYRDLPMHVCFVCWEKVVDDEDVGTKIVPDLFGKKAPTAALGFLDVVGRMYVEQDDGDMVTKILFAKVPHITAGDRTGKLPRVMVKPAMVEIFELLNGKQQQKGK